MAADDGTAVYVDADNNGTFESTNTLNEGQTVFVDGGVGIRAIPRLTPISLPGMTAWCPIFGRQAAIW